jgi:hypothetical protein
VHALRKYLGAWAEPEAKVAAAVERVYERVLVVPAYREDPRFLDGYTAAFAAAPGRALCVVVANAKDNIAAGEATECERLRDALVERLAGARLVSDAPRAFFGPLNDAVDVVVVDRVGEGARLPAKQGVGLARKIGADLALAVHARGLIRSPWIYFGDADATLPGSYFERAHEVSRSDVSVALYPFWHAPGDEPEVTRATALYEVSLRYFVLGLGFAGSPYAFQALGSTLAVRAEAYAAVRGVPRREAAEDFYLLNKLAKVGTVARLAGEPIALRARRSDRVPFGTGASVTAFSAGGVRLYAPECFVALRETLSRLDAFAEHADVARFVSEVRGLGVAGQSVLDGLGAADIETALGAASREAKTPAARRLRAHGWFDAFRTMKVVHALRDHAFPSVPWREALGRAPFVPPVEGTHEAEADDSELTPLRRAMQTAEDSCSPWLGPAAFRPG